MTEEPVNPENKISVEDYRRILGGLKLDNIILTKSSCEIKREEASPQSTISLKEDSSFGTNKSGDIEVSQEYHLVAHNQTTKKKLLDIKYRVCVIYKSAEAFTPEFFETFKKVNLSINTWPYFREFVSSMTSRMYIPPITLPLLKR